ncbi:MAG TPA: AAA family ATPase [Pseudonocardia sp.]|nr:AAA family ATPase [Pseudonocardia sp.]
MTRLAVPGRTLLLVAGMPGAGKSTLLRGLPVRPGLRVLDSDRYRDLLSTALRPMPYRWYRPLVHLWHRLAAVAAAASAAPTVVVHLPATGAGTRAVVARLARLTGRTPHLLWLHVEPAEALRGQRERGRVVPGASFAGHAERAAAATARLRAAGTAPTWATVTVLDREAARTGLVLDTDPDPAAAPGRGPRPDAAAPVERAPTRPQ